MMEHAATLSERRGRSGIVTLYAGRKEAGQAYLAWGFTFTDGPDAAGKGHMQLNPRSAPQFWTLIGGAWRLAKYAAATKWAAGLADI